MTKIKRVEEEQVMQDGKIIAINYNVWYFNAKRRDYRHGHYTVIPATVLNYILDEGNEAVTRYQEYNGCLYKRTMYQPAEQEQEAPAETETEQATEETTAPTDAAELDSLKAIRDDITTDPNPDTIRAAQDAINRHFVEIDPEDIDMPRKIRAALTDIINAIYWDIAEDITPATTATETAAPLQLETLSARLDRMTAAELVNLYAATSAPGSIDDETDSAIYIALHAINPRAYRVWMKTSIEYNPGDPASIEAANAADVERLRAAYGVTA